jgi:hypothetical protein
MCIYFSVLGKYTFAQSKEPPPSVNQFMYKVSIVQCTLYSVQLWVLPFNSRDDIFTIYFRL